MTTYEVPVRCLVKVRVAPDAEYAIDRFVNLQPDNDMGWTPGCTRQDILNYLAISCVAYSRDDASNLDGFADLDNGMITMHDYDYEEADY